MTKTYIETKKSDWLKCLKTYYSLYRTKSKEKYLIERFRSDYGLKLQNYKADKQMQKKKITFKPSAIYL